MTAQPAHKKHTKDFDGLTYSEQAKSINAAMAWCSKAMRAHLRRAQADGRDIDAVRVKCLNQLNRLLSRVSKI